jgi:hypothetical protein
MAGFNFMGFTAAAEMGQQLNADFQEKQQDIALKKQQLSMNATNMQNQQQDRAQQQAYSQQVANRYKTMDGNQKAASEANGTSPNTSQMKADQDNIAFLRGNQLLAYSNGQIAAGNDFEKQIEAATASSDKHVAANLKIANEQTEAVATVATDFLTDPNAPGAAQAYIDKVGETQGMEAKDKLQKMPIAQLISTAHAAQGLGLSTESKVKSIEAATDKKETRRIAAQVHTDNEEDKRLQRQGIDEQRRASNSLARENLTFRKEQAKLKVADPLSQAQGEAAGAYVATGAPISGAAGYSGKNKQILFNKGITSIMEETGMSAKEAGIELAKREVNFKVTGQVLAATEKRAAGMEMGASEIKYDVNTMLGTVAKGVATGGNKFLNTPMNKIRGEMSNTDLLALQTTTSQVATKYEKFMAGGILSVSQMHSGLAEDAKKLLNGNMTMAEIKTQVPLMIREMDNAQKATDDVKKKYMAGLGPKPAGAAGAVKPYSDAGKEAKFQAWKKEHLNGQ